MISRSSQKLVEFVLWLSCLTLGLQAASQVAKLGTLEKLQLIWFTVQQGFFGLVYSACEITFFIKRT